MLAEISETVVLTVSAYACVWVASLRVTVARAWLTPSDQSQVIRLVQVVSMLLSAVSFVWVLARESGVSLRAAGTLLHSNGFGSCKSGDDSRLRNSHVKRDLLEIDSVSSGRVVVTSADVNSLNILQSHHELLSSKSELWGVTSSPFGFVDSNLVNSIVIDFHRNVFQLDSVVSNDNNLWEVAEILLIGSDSVKSSSVILVPDFESEESIVTGGSISDHCGWERPVKRGSISWVTVEVRWRRLETTRNSRRK